MKRAFLAVSCAGLLWAGCKEKDPPIDFGISKSIDTTYFVTPVPSPEPHNVLAEEFTGEGCNNCPAAHTLLENLSNSHPGRMNIIGLYFYGLPQGIPPAGAAYDFRDSTATMVANNVYGVVGAIPSGGIDRVPPPGATSILAYSGDWSSQVDNQLNMLDSLNLSVASKYDATTKTATITALVTYTSPVTYPQNISVVVIEDSIVDFQEIATAPNVDSNYLFIGIFRSMITSAPFGNPLTSADKGDVKEAGRVFQRIYSYKPKSNLKPEHCRVVAFVNSPGGSNYRVYQSKQCKLMGP
jgi:Outer membrane protein Omp28